MSLSLRPNDLAFGSLFYECQYGINIEAVVVSAPCKTIGPEGRAQWSWNARDTQTARIIAYLATEGLGAHGPQIYSEPQYVSRNAEGAMVFRLAGGEEIDSSRPDPLSADRKQYLAAWARSVGERPNQPPFRKWILSLAEEASVASRGILEMGGRFYLENREEFLNFVNEKALEHALADKAAPSPSQ